MRLEEAGSPAADTRTRLVGRCPVDRPGVDTRAVDSRAAGSLLQLVAAEGERARVGVVQLVRVRLQPVSRELVVARGSFLSGWRSKQGMRQARRGAPL